MQGNEIRNDVPEEWKANLKKGLCPVCAKTRDEFAPRMRVYCSHECRAKYYEKISSWSELRDEFLEEHGEFCDECSGTKESMNKREDEAWIKFAQKFAAEHPDKVEKERASLLKEAEDCYRKAQDDVYLARRVASHMDFRLEFGYIGFQVDHIVPTALDGPKWDKSNLQVLCVQCHKKKTKEDMKEIREENK